MADVNNRSIEFLRKGSTGVILVFFVRVVLLRKFFSTGFRVSIKVGLHKTTSSQNHDIFLS